ncbi:hypothetical protein N657DRAFT_693139 [Parathielavia appendiculata]|uniref:Xylanolytic transcriptional activator regulatory domain-containing protein n=1 Tax=Parathielavia appendiculata TaxID=2587402 RepID=A0AAN6TT73_9PEZI|nr:hypothetical protein N657DRAFT_693139 [Parathielavia appendiculata]
MLVEHASEKKIDHIDRRLDGVVRLLEELKTQLPSRSPTPTPVPVPAVTASSSTVASSGPTSHASHSTNAESTENVVEGESSLTAHSVFANDLLQKVMSRDSRPEMKEKIEALRHMVEVMKKQPAAHEMTYPHARPVRPAAFEGCDLPPIEKTVQVLKLAKSHQQLGLAWIFELFEMDRFPETCLNLYMADDYNVAHFITVNVSLHYLFWTYGSLLLDRQAEYFRLAHLCGVNIETALSSLPLHLPATDDMLVALSLGAFYAVELAKPSLAWILSSKASELCQSLGYHRMATFLHESPEPARRKQFLFWIAFILDKSLSLRLGRSSTIQCNDITVPEPTSGNPGHTPMITAFFGLWVIGSRLQGEIYELLYCPGAINQPHHVRRSHADLLLQRLEELDTLTEAEAKRWDGLSRESCGNDMTDFFVLSDHVLRLSIRTLIHRAMPNTPGSPTTFSVACIRAARETLARHQECMAVVERTKVGLFSTYMNWTILFAPFVPFIVLFCQVIETRDRADLARLEGFVASLQPHTAATEAVDKLRRLFHVLYSVASQYVESLVGATGDVQQPSTEVDTCLAALGFSSSQPVPGQQEAGFLPGSGMGDFNEQASQRGVNPMIWMGNGTQLEDWFYNNQQMMTFLEDGFPEEVRWGGS